MNRPLLTSTAQTVVFDLLRHRAVIAAACLLSFGCASTAIAQEGLPAPNVARMSADNTNGQSTTDGDCRQCHFCVTPTKWNRCLLHVCSRGRIQGQDGGENNRGPNIVILDKLEGEYLPVPFDHSGHAKMAEMAGGCETCHHYTPEGEQHPGCDACHDAAASGTDIYKPGLKGAYHQHCMNCHRDWVDETDCSVCHTPRANGKPSQDVASPVTQDDLVGRIHPPIPEPETDYYGGSPVQANGPAVVFRHGEHVQRFGLNCVDCHHEPSCARCHNQDAEPETALTQDEHHRPCIRCHKEDMNGAAREASCSHCHWENGSPYPTPFDHASVGWPLSRFHRSLGCRECHVSVPFVKRNSDCNACHSDWSQTTFNHRVTGQVLDETHAETDCVDCHVDREFTQPPSCTECHDVDDDGVSFPAKRPGPVFNYGDSREPE